MKGYEFLEHTADVFFRAYGNTAEEMLESSAAALIASMIDPSTVREEESWKVELESDSLEDLAYDWLSELVFLFDSERAVFSRFEVSLAGNWKLDATVWGERIDRKRHLFDCEVKAVTLHKFQVKFDDRWTLQAVLDV